MEQEKASSYDLEAGNNAWEQMAQEFEAEREQDVKDEFEFTETLFDYEVESPKTTANLMSGIAGVYADIKPVAFEHAYYEAINEQNDEMVQDSLRRLGIAAEVVGEDRDENDLILRTWYFSKQPELISQLREAFQDLNASPNENTTDTANRQIGKLLGYPETATEYFIERSHFDDLPPIPQASNQLGQYIHSPDHAEAESAQYERPLRAAMEKYCPNSLAELLS